MSQRSAAKEVRAWYAIEEHIHDRELAHLACTAVLDLVHSAARRVVIDAYTDYRKQMPDHIVRVQEALYEIGRSQHRRDPGMNVGLDPRAKDDWTLLVEYAPWSTNVDIYDAADERLGTLHDCGHAVSARLLPAQGDDLARQLAGRLTVVPFRPR